MLCRTFVALVVLPLLASCAAPYTVRTVGRNQVALRASVGGPLIGNLGGAAPLPAVVLGGTYGLTDDWDLHGSFHLVSAIYKTAGIDGAVTRRLLRQSGAIPEWTATMRLSVFGNLSTLRVYPEVETFASYLLRRRVLLYLGLSTFFDFFPDEAGRVRVNFGPALGTDVRLGRRHVLGLALRWISPQENTAPLVTDWVSPGRYGMIFVQVGYRFHFGGFGGQP